MQNITHTPHIIVWDYDSPNDFFSHKYKRQQQTEISTVTHIMPFIYSLSTGLLASL